MIQLLTEPDKAKVSEAIRSIESSTSGELVIVIAGASDDYWYIPSLWAALISLIAPAVMLLYGVWLDATEVVVIQIVLFVSLIILFRIPMIKRLLIPSYIKRQRASRVAREQFFIQGLQNTMGRTGILLFVSVAEHYVEIIADKGINDVVPDGSWDSIVVNFVNKMKNKQYVEGFLSAITDCGAILIEHYPAQRDDVNELHDHLIEI